MSSRGEVGFNRTISSIQVAVLLFVFIVAGAQGASFFSHRASEQAAAVLLAQTGAALNPLTAPAYKYRGQSGKQVTYHCPSGNSASGSIWGTDVYTDDSSVCSAGVHAGVITYASGGLVTIEIAPGQSAYTSTTRNGVKSYAYGRYTGSFIVKTTAVAPATPTITLTAQYSNNGVLVSYGGTNVPAGAIADVLLVPMGGGNVIGIAGGQPATGMNVSWPVNTTYCDTVSSRCDIPFVPGTYVARVNIVLNGQVIATKDSASMAIQMPVCPTGTTGTHPNCTTIPSPTCRLSATPASVQAGGVVTLTWASTDALSGRITSPGAAGVVGFVSGNPIVAGSLDVSLAGVAPNATAGAVVPFTMVFTGSGFTSATCEASVTVARQISQTPTITLVSPVAGATYTVGEPIPISWKATNVPANTEVQFELTSITPDAYARVNGGVGGGVAQSNELNVGSNEGVRSWATGAAVGGLTLSGTYQVKVSLRACNVNGCDKILNGPVLATAQPVIITVKQPVVPTATLQMYMNGQLFSTVPNVTNAIARSICVMTIGTNGTCYWSGDRVSLYQLYGKPGDPEISFQNPPRATNQTIQTGSNYTFKIVDTGPSTAASNYKVYLYKYSANNPAQPERVYEAIISNPTGSGTISLPWNATRTTEGAIPAGSYEIFALNTVSGVWGNVSATTYLVAPTASTCPTGTTGTYPNCTNTTQVCPVPSVAPCPPGQHYVTGSPATIPMPNFPGCTMSNQVCVADTTAPSGIPIVSVDGGPTLTFATGVTLLSGSATNTTNLSVVITSVNGGSAVYTNTAIPVTNGRWTFTVLPALASGSYIARISSGSTLLYNASLNVVAPTTTTGNRVYVAVSAANVRANPSISAPIGGTQYRGAQGTISGASVSADGYMWYLVNFDSGVDGWTVTTNVQPISGGQTQTCPTGTTGVYPNCTNTPTTAVFSVSRSFGYAPLPVTFTSGYGFPLSLGGSYLLLNFGDGSSPENVVCAGSAGICTTPATISHTYATPGTYTATIIENRAVVGFVPIVRGTVTVTVR